MIPSIILSRQNIFIAVAFTSTSWILPPTYIAKFIFASASHVITSGTFLHPEFATRALLEFGPFHKQHEVFSSSPILDIYWYSLQDIFLCR